jgi:molybdenum cofactor cytidylyltransferase
MKIVDALRLLMPQWMPVRLALVGAGGKSSFLFSLAWELISQKHADTVIITTTTHLATHQAVLADHHYIVKTPDDVKRIFFKLPAGVILFSGAVIREKKVESPGGDTLSTLVQLADETGLPLLIEADGSRQRPIKAPAAHEPVIPEWVNYVVVMASLVALGKPVSETWVHRPERLIELIEQSMGSLFTGEGISPAILGSLLTHPQGGLKGIPEKARRVVLLNGASNATLAAQAGSLKKVLLRQYEAVVVADLLNVNVPLPPKQSGESASSSILAVYERVAGIVLAAGASRRFAVGKTDIPKQLLLWRGEPLVRHVCKAASGADLSQVVVVTGSNADAVREAVINLHLEVVYNATWSDGQSTSLVKGLQAVDPGTGGVIFFLADQPQVPAVLIRSLIERHTQTLSPLVAPQVAGRRANPVLFDRVTFPELLTLEGDEGGRVLFSRHPVTWLPWLDESLLMDVDTQADYQRLLSKDRNHSRLAAVVLAAGLSSRMGQPKMLLPWGKTSVIRHVVGVLEKSGLADIYVVTGSVRENIEKELLDSKAKLVFNPKFADEEMIVSLQTGLASLPEEIGAAMVVLGDQPQIEVDVVRRIIREYHATNHPLIVPSYQMRRGHPWLVHHSLWDEILTLRPNQSLRDFLSQKSASIHYLVLENPSILRDLDIMEDWEQEHP